MECKGRERERERVEFVAPEGVTVSVGQKMQQVWLLYPFTICWSNFIFFFYLTNFRVPKEVEQTLEPIAANLEKKRSRELIQK